MHFKVFKYKELMFPFGVVVSFFFALKELVRVYSKLCIQVCEPMELQSEISQQERAANIAHLSMGNSILL